MGSFAGQHRLTVTMKNRGTDFAWGHFFDGFTRDRPRTLLLDYDGTLAPFRVERDQAVIDPPIRDVLERILRAGRTRVVIISGRALGDLIPLLHLEPLPELWGSHGWQRRLPDGQTEDPKLAPPVADALARAREWIRSAELDSRCEQKPAGVALHWRGLEAGAVDAIRDRAQETWELLAKTPGLALHPFDGGLELRATGRDKGYAVARILRDMPAETIIAYAGDDDTDEDAFRALSDRGLSILVRSDYRPTAAHRWLRPPEEWLNFLQAWMAADQEGE